MKKVLQIEFPLLLIGIAVLFLTSSKAFAGRTPEPTPSSKKTIQSPSQTGQNADGPSSSQAYSPSARRSSESTSVLPSIYQIQLRSLDGKNISMASYQGKLLLIVNTASSCGFTPQMKDLVDLQSKYSARGLQILGFPSNDFHQENGSAAEIQKFADKEFRVNFPLFEKASVRGSQVQPIFRYLTENSDSFPKDVLWNFEKFLVSPSGKVIARYRSSFKPSQKELEQKIEELLPKSIQ